MFTLEIDGTAIAVINGDEATARDLFTCDGFKEDIRTLTVDGKPIWNGTSELKVRAASQDEIEEFDEAIAADQGDGEFEPDPQHADDASDDEGEDEADIVFLVDIDDEDEDQDEA
ncbi:hypothetical protein [Methylorubrum salsuginis]|uniref:Glutamine amidotransferase n=1 Tax=Methylorubrum salsuginis TaxID=414703 RepID=A0A1I4G5Q2_9HYPH|nr:hypothetical protein [Methylorubrum salsuginis]SFL24431.1 hypothetical protein SAMN04488125_11177 [Methylorubrum salsuginis]